MDYINTVLNFLNAHSIVILPILFLAVLVYGIVNWICNPYRKQNKKLVACYRGIVSHPDKIAQYADSLPEDYRRQWRVIVNCEVKPSLVFEFVEKRKRVYLLWLFVVAATVSACYVAVFFVTESYISYLVFQVVFWLAFGLVTVANKAVGKLQQKRARKIFAQFATQVNRRAPFNCDLTDTAKQLQQLGRCEVDDGVVGKASQLLHSKGLYSNRTVDEQRRINSALNGLLQAYSRNSLRSKT